MVGIAWLHSVIVETDSTATISAAVVAAVAATIDNTAASHNASDTIATTVIDVIISAAAVRMRVNSAAAAQNVPQ